MADAQEHNVVEIDEEERMLVAALKAVKEKKARILEEAEEKRRADEAAEEKRKADEAAKAKRKADEAEAKRKVDEKRKVEEAEAQKVDAARKVKEAEEAAEKKKVAEALIIRAANEALQVGIETHETHKKQVEEAAWAEAMAFETRRKKLAALGATWMTH
jgi:hypothetical protein